MHPAEAITAARFEGLFAESTLTLPAPVETSFGSDSLADTLLAASKAWRAGDQNKPSNFKEPVVTAASSTSVISETKVESSSYNEIIKLLERELANERKERRDEVAFLVKTHEREVSLLKSRAQSAAQQFQEERQLLEKENSWRISQAEVAEERAQRLQAESVHHSSAIDMRLRAEVIQSEATVHQEIRQRAVRETALRQEMNQLSCQARSLQERLHEELEECKRLTIMLNAVDRDKACDNATIKMLRSEEVEHDLRRARHETMYDEQLRHALADQRSELQIAFHSEIRQLKKQLDFAEAKMEWRSQELMMEEQQLLNKYQMQQNHLHFLEGSMRAHLDLIDHETQLSGPHSTCSRSWSRLRSPLSRGWDREWHRYGSTHSSADLGRNCAVSFATEPLAGGSEIAVPMSPKRGTPGLGMPQLLQGRPTSISSSYS